MIRKQISAAGTALSNSTTETSLAKHTFFPGALTPGKVYQILGSARATATNSTDTAQMRVRFGSSTTVSSNTAVGAASAVDVANDDVSIVIGYLIAQTTTRAVFLGVLSDCDANASKLVGSGSTILTIDQSTTYYLDLTAVWSVASASNSIQAEAFTVVEIT